MSGFSISLLAKSFPSVEFAFILGPPEPGVKEACARPVDRTHAVTGCLREHGPASVYCPSMCILDKQPWMWYIPAYERLSKPFPPRATGPTPVSTACSPVSTGAGYPRAGAKYELR